MPDMTTGAENTQHTHTYWFFSSFQWCWSVLGQVLLLRVQDEMLEVPTSEREDPLLRDVPQWR